MMLIKIKDRRGLSHVEMILSFVIFIGFLIFVFAIFKPYEISDTDDVYLDIAERGIRMYTDTELRFFTVSLNKSLGNCFFLYSDLKNISVKNENSEFVEALSLSGKIYINNNGRFFYIYSSEDFEEKIFNNIDCLELLDKVDYTRGLMRNSNITSYIKLGIFRQEYDSDYEEIKEQIGLPPSKEFSFNVRDILGNPILNAKNAPKGIKVLARDAPIQIVYKNGTLNYAMLNVQVW